MNQREPITEIMTTEVISVSVEDKLSDVREKLRHYKVRHVPVLDGQKLVGVLSRTDLNRLSFSSLFPDQNETDENIFNMLTLPQVMSHKPRVVKSNQTVMEVAEILAKEEFHALPVVDERDNTKLVGMVTTTDLIKYLLDHF
jgi:CBS domain-containing protein